jgi:hypothetical protein
MRTRILPTAEREIFMAHVGGAIARVAVNATPLAEIKRRYDPNNLFGINQNVWPTTSATPRHLAINAGRLSTNPLWTFLASS